MSVGLLENLAALPMFAGFPTSILQHIIAAANHHTESENKSGGTLILHENSTNLAFYVLLTGQTRIFLCHPDGREVTVRLMTAPAVFGELECITGAAYHESVELVGDGSYLALPRAEFLRLVDTVPLFTRRLFDDVATRFLLTITNERRLAFTNVDERLCMLLVDLAGTVGTPHAAGIVLPKTISLTSLARHLGVSLRSVARSMSLLTELQIIRHLENGWTILDMQKLIAQSPRMQGIAHTQSA